MELGVGGCPGPCLAMSGFSLCTREGPPHHAAGLAGVLGRLRWAAILRGAPIWGGGGGAGRRGVPMALRGLRLGWWFGGRRAGG